ncbi:MAG TPA: HNH endonuclease [Ktedonobacteraceae bacterium]
MSKEPIDVFQLIDMSGGPNACWPWRGGYGGRARDKRPYFQANGVRTMAYRWVWELVNGPIPEGMMILHSCDRGGYPTGCCQPAHLRLGTVRENSDDMNERERHGLPHNAIRAIRKLLGEGVAQQEIASRFGVSRETISAIATQRVYSHVPDKADDT